MMADMVMIVWEKYLSDVVNLCCRSESILKWLQMVLIAFLCNTKGELGSVDIEMCLFTNVLSGVGQ